MERCKISDKFIIFSKCDKLPGYCLEDALNWLNDIYNGPFKECQKIRNMQSEEMWKRYEVWEEFSDFHEMKLYTAKLDAFKNQCRHRPLIFKHASCEQAIAENERAKPRNKKPKKDRKNED